MPASFQKRSSAACVPERSPREMKGALAAAMRRKPSTASLPRGLRRIGVRADDDEVVVHDVVALGRVALGDEGVLGRPIVHEHDVRVAAPADVEGLAGAERHDLHRDAGIGSEERQEMAEQARLLGRGRRGDGDRAVLRGDGKARGECQAGGDEEADRAHGNLRLPPVTAPANRAQALDPTARTGADREAGLMRRR